MKIRNLLIIVVVFVMLLSACGQQNTPTQTNGGNIDSYPIETDVTLTYWSTLNTAISSIAPNFGDTPFAKKLAEETGVTIKYIHPPQGQEAASLSLMIASDELADIIGYGWLNFQGGPSKAIKDQIIVPLNEHMEYAPNLKGFLNENPDINRSVKTDEGDYYGFPFIRNDKSLLISSGPIIRKDWLDDLGLPVPETYAELEETLIAFRDKKGATAPLSVICSSSSRNLLNILNTTDQFYVENGVVKYAQIENEYKEVMILLNKWFNEGLLDKNFISLDSKILDANILNDKVGVTFGSGGGGLGKWIDAAKDKTNGFELAGVKHFVKNKGDTNRFADVTFPYATHFNAAVTASCKNIPVAVKFLDYGYGEEGRMLYNFGEEGVSYEMVNGYPTYTDLIMKNPDGLNVSQAMGLYLKASHMDPFIQDKRYIEQYYQYPQQKEALNNWVTTIDKTLEFRLPQVAPTMEESAEFANIMSEIEKYCNEMRVKYITGITPIDEFDAYVKRIKDLKLDKALEIQQKALERFNKR